jgi:hypothetical protein
MVDFKNTCKGLIMAVHIFNTNHLGGGDQRESWFEASVKQKAQDPI